MFDNNRLGEIRPNQLITTFGPGSIVDAVKDSVTVLDLNYWKEKGKKIIDGRLAAYLGVDCFYTLRVRNQKVPISPRNTFTNRNTTTTVCVFTLSTSPFICSCPPDAAHAFPPLPA